MTNRVFLDNNAGTPLDPRLIPVLIQHLNSVYGNPSSPHKEGQEARSILNQSRLTLANYLHVKPSEIVFTSGGTEGLNMMLRGLVLPPFKGHIITSSVEHPAVFNTIKYLETLGVEVTYLNPGPWGAVKVEAVEEAIRPNTLLISLMAVNNETGVKTDIASIASVAKQMKIPFVVDGVAWIGKESFMIPDGVSAVAFSGYKFHAPSGVGFVYVRSSLRFTPLLTGGEQEHGRRSGTENLTGIVGMSEAVKLLKEAPEERIRRITYLRDKLEKGILTHLSGVRVNGEGPRVCNTTNFCFDGIEGETLLARLDMKGISVSHGSACASGGLEPSRILLNMGLSRSQAASALRFSLSRLTTEEEIDYTLETLIQLVKQLRKL